jgi:hypothetical protein
MPAAAPCLPDVEGKAGESRQLKLAAVRGPSAQSGERCITFSPGALQPRQCSNRGHSMQKALNKVAPVAFAVSALGGVLGEDTAAGFALTACGAAVLGLCVWLLIYRV